MLCLSANEKGIWKVIKLELDFVRKIRLFKTAYLHLQEKFTYKVSH